MQYPYVLSGALYDLQSTLKLLVKYKARATPIKNIAIYLILAP
jgi:hypothetical protein